MTRSFFFSCLCGSSFYATRDKFEEHKKACQKWLSTPLSAKGIVFDKDKVWLRKNERDEWELPGGKVGSGETPEKTVVRELKEELGFDTEVIEMVHAASYMIPNSLDESHGVFIISYLCKLLNKTGDFEVHGEAGLAAFQTFSLEEVEQLNMPAFYKYAIRYAWNKM